MAAGSARDRARHLTFRRVVLVTPLVFTSACHPDTANEKTLAGPSNPAAATTLPAADQILERYRHTESSLTSVTKLRAKIAGEDASEREVRLTMYRKRQPDGRAFLLVHFTAPPEERDRDGLVITGPAGDIEAVRYMQSADRFVTTTSATGEDSLFGMTLQELVGGQPHKYEFRLTGEAMVGASAAYRLEGSLHQGAESRFSRMVLFISKENHAALGMELYDDAGELARRLAVQQLAQVAGYWTRMRWSVENLARARTVEFETLEVKYDLPLHDSVFSRANLKKLSSR